jgi:hypothetical protein
MDINLSYGGPAAKVMLRVMIWDDRSVWVDVRRSSKKGWVWAVTAQGRFVGSRGAEDLVADIEATLGFPHAPDPSGDIAKIWKAHLASGPAQVT